MNGSPEDLKAGIAGGFDWAAMTYDTVIPFFETFAQYLVDSGCGSSGPARVPAVLRPR